MLTHEICYLPCGHLRYTDTWLGPRIGYVSATDMRWIRCRYVLSEYPIFPFFVNIGYVCRHVSASLIRPSPTRSSLISLCPEAPDALAFDARTSRRLQVTRSLATSDEFLPLRHGSRLQRTPVISSPSPFSIFFFSSVRLVA
jgi:hypothetical protein